MKIIFTIIKITLAVAVLNAAARFGIVAYGHYSLKDEAQQLVLFGAQTATVELQNSLLEKAAEFKVPLTADNIVVTRVPPRTIINVAYTRPVEWFPRQIHVLDLKFNVEGFMTPGGGAGSKR